MINHDLFHRFVLGNGVWYAVNRLDAALKVLQGGVFDQFSLNIFIEGAGDQISLKKVLNGAVFDQISFEKVFTEGAFVQFPL